MSVYRYECPHGHRFEVRRSMEDDPVVEECPRCREAGVMLFSPAPFSFGWRLTEQSHISGPDEIEKDV